MNTRTDNTSRNIMTALQGTFSALNNGGHLSGAPAIFPVIAFPSMQTPVNSWRLRADLLCRSFAGMVIGGALYSHISPKSMWLFGVVLSAVAMAVLGMYQLITRPWESEKNALSLKRTKSEKTSLPDAYEHESQWLLSSQQHKPRMNDLELQRLQQPELHER